MPARVRDRLVPAAQRRTPEELTADLDLRSGEGTAKVSAFWTMLVLSAVIAAAGVLADSTATVIGAMVIAPLSTPIMGIALSLVKRTRTGAGRFVLGGAAAEPLAAWGRAIVSATAGRRSWCGTAAMARTDSPRARAVRPRSSGQGSL